MKPAPGTYRLTTTGTPPMDVTVTQTTLVMLLDTFDYNAAADKYVARHLSCVMECLGTGNGQAFVGVSPGQVVAYTCEKLS